MNDPEVLFKANDYEVCRRGDALWFARRNRGIHLFMFWLIAPFAALLAFMPVAVVLDAIGGKRSRWALILGSVGGILAWLSLLAMRWFWRRQRAEKNAPADLVRDALMLDLAAGTLRDKMRGISQSSDGVFCDGSSVRMTRRSAEGILRLHLRWPTGSRVICESLDRDQIMALRARLAELGVPGSRGLPAGLPELPGEHDSTGEP